MAIVDNERAQRGRVPYRATVASHVSFGKRQVLQRYRAGAGKVQVENPKLVLAADGDRAAAVNRTRDSDRRQNTLGPQHDCGCADLKGERAPAGALELGKFRPELVGTAVIER